MMFVKGIEIFMKNFFKLITHPLQITDEITVTIVGVFLMIVILGYIGAYLKGHMGYDS